jgi:hypothetical protein
VRIPERVREYATYNLHARWDMPRLADATGVSNALVFVRDSWGAQLNARLWAIGVNRPDARRFRLFIDRCLLEAQVTALEHAKVRGAAATAALAPLMRDSARIVPVLVGGTHSTATLPGIEYTKDCTARLRDDADDVTDYHPLRIAGGSNIYARDLNARDTLLLAKYPDRPIYLLRARWVNDRREPYFTPLSRDSVWMAWTGQPEPAPANASRD